MKRYVVYQRVSTKGQGESGLGLEAQQRDIDVFLKTYSDEPYEVVDTFVEVESGAKRRPIMQKALERARETDAELLVQKLDRLGREVVDLAPLLAKGAKPNIRVAQLPYADRFQLHIYASLAEQERDFISERTKAALEVAKSKGKKLGGLRPGTAARNEAMKRSADTDAQRIASIIKPMRDADSTLQQIADALNEASIPTPRGKSWHPSSVKNALARV